MSSSDSDRPRAELYKNGHEKIQDKEIEHLNHQFTEYLKDYSEFKKQVYNTQSTMSVVLDRAREEVEQVRADLKAYGLVAKFLWGLVFIFLTSLGSVIGYYASQLNSLGEKVVQIDSRTQVDWANGRRWGEALDRDVAILRQDIKEIRQLIDQRHSKSGTSFFADDDSHAPTNHSSRGTH